MRIAQGQLRKRNVFQARFPSTPKSTRFAKVPRKSTGHKPSVRWWSEPLLGLLKCETTSGLAPLPKLANLGCNLAGLSVLVEPKSYEQEWGATRGKACKPSKMGQPKLSPHSNSEVAEEPSGYCVSSFRTELPDKGPRNTGRTGPGPAKIWKSGGRKAPRSRGHPRTTANE